MLGPLSWVLIYTDRVAAMRAFYRDVLEIPVTRDGDDIVVFGTGACTLELMGRLENGPDALDDTTGWQRNKILISFRVADITAAMARIEARGVRSLIGIRPTVSPPGKPPRGLLAQVMDPDGNIIEFCQMDLP
jgi:predicted enzyme related to lactoylglutathione lyase